MRLKCLAKKPWFLGLKPPCPFTSALLACAEAHVTLCEDEPLARPVLSYGVLRPGLLQPPGRGDGDRDISVMPGVPGIVARDDSPNERPELPLATPSRLRVSV